MKKISALAFFITLLTSSIQAQEYKLSSPGKKYTVGISTSPRISFSILRGNEVIVPKAIISMSLKGGKILGEMDAVKRRSSISVNEIITPAVPIKNKIISNDYNQLSLQFKSGYTVAFRAYDDAVAYRFETNLGDKIIVSDEQFDVQFPEESQAWFSYLQGNDDVSDRWMTSYEKVYQKEGLNNWHYKSPAELPLLVDLATKGKLLITESDLRDYAGLYLKKDKNNTLRSVFPPKVKENIENKKGAPNWDRTLRPKSVYDYIAETGGNRTFPWRIIALAEKDIDLLNNEIVYKLGESDKLENTDWIKPGQVAWDWWNDWNISGVNFEAGINTKTYKYYIDFAATHKIPYIIMDDGWYQLGDLTKVNPDIDMQELTRYAKEKNVGIILWASWLTLDHQMEEALDLFQSWDIKGIKVDFMDRDDQDVVNFYWRTAKETAKRHLIVDFHGAHKPTGLNRVYPNVINFEGVAGMENSKWGEAASPDMAASIPFIRMFTGPLDYTPGAMRNANKSSFRPVNSMPMSQGTRVQQLAMYILFDAPLQMLSDNPSAYLKEKESLDFITSTPVVWDETFPLSGKVGEYLVMGRKKDNQYFAGAITNWQARDLDIEFSFLPAGNWKIELFRDGINANRDATDYIHEIKTITNSDKLNIHLAPGGGFAARIYQ